MKYFILVPDGCGDRPVPSLGGRTPLEAAVLNNINGLAKTGETGLVKTIPDGAEPGSEAGNLSILGYDPNVYLTGRAPFEAAAMDIPMRAEDTAFRASLVTLEGEGPYEGMAMRDHSSGEIENEDAEVLLRYLDEKLGQKGRRFYPGVSYRGLMITDTDENVKIMEPHNILGRRIGDYIPGGKAGELMAESHILLKSHPLNALRIKNGKPPANSVWLWGQGKKLTLPPLEEKYKVKGCMIAAVNLLKGIAKASGMSCASIPGATGTLHTNYRGKAEGAIEAFEEGADFVFVHVEAPDECSHTGDLDGKIKSLEFIDDLVFAPVAEYLARCGGPYRILVLPDHMTPLEIRTHSPEPTPFVLFDSQKTKPADGSKVFSEACGGRGRFFNSGESLADYFFMLI